MKINKNSLAMTAAFTGLLSGTIARLNAVPAPNYSSSALSSLAGEMSAASADKKEKHACEGKNSCKGKGGCKTSANGCKGKNDCKGKGGCATDGSKKDGKEKKGDKKMDDKKMDDKKPGDQQ